MADLVGFGERRLGGIVYRLINWSKNSNETNTLGLFDIKTVLRDLISLCPQIGPTLFCFDRS